MARRTCASLILALVLISWTAAGTSAPPTSHLDTFPYCECKRSQRLSRFGVEPEVIYHEDKFCFRLRAAATCAKPEDSCCQQGTSVTKFKVDINPSCLRTTYEDYVGKSLDALVPTTGLVRLEAQKGSNPNGTESAVLLIKPEAPWPTDYADGLLVCFQHVHGPCATPEQLCATDPDVGCRVALFTNGYKCCPLTTAYLSGQAAPTAPLQQPSSHYPSPPPSTSYAPHYSSPGPASAPPGPSPRPPRAPYMPWTPMGPDTVSAPPTDLNVPPPAPPPPEEPHTVIVDPASGSRCLTVTSQPLVAGARVCFDTCQPGTPRDEQVFQFVRCPAGGSILSVTKGGQDLCAAFSASGQGALADCDCEDPSQVVGFDGSTFVDAVAGPRGSCKLVLGDGDSQRCLVPAESCTAPLLGNCTAPRATFQCVPTSVRPYRPWVRVQDVLGACLTVNGATAGSGAALAQCGAEGGGNNYGQQFLITTATTGTDEADNTGHASFRLLARAGLAQSGRRLCLGAANATALSAGTSAALYRPLQLQPCSRRALSPASPEALQSVLFGRTPLGGDPVVPGEVPPTGFLTFGFPAVGGNCSYSVGAWQQQRGVVDAGSSTAWEQQQQQRGPDAGPASSGGGSPSQQQLRGADTDPSSSVSSSSYLVLTAPCTGRVEQVFYVSVAEIGQGLGQGST